MRHRIAPHKSIQIQAIDCASRVRIEPAAEPWDVVPGAIVVEASAVVALLAGVAVLLALDFLLALASYDGRAAIGKVLFIADQLGCAVQL